MSNFNEETVLDVQHWTDRLFSFRTTRNPAFRFQNGQFTMMGVEIQGRPLVRAYSLVSANYEDQLEFFSIKVPDGPLTRAVREGAICYLDEVVEARQDTTVLLHPLADHRRQLLIERLGLNFEVLSDGDLALARALRLPTFMTGGETYFKRLSLAIENGRIDYVFYPVHPPDAHARDVLAWLTDAVGYGLEGRINPSIAPAR